MDPIDDIVEPASPELLTVEKCFEGLGRHLRLTRAEELATPTRRRVNELRNVIDDHHGMDWTRKMFDDFNDLEGVAYDAGRLCHALDPWKHWANGRNIDNAALA